MAVSRRLPKASDLVVSAVSQRILTERLPVGHRLPSETELMEEYGLGRVTVREALRLLERDGLIEIKRGPGGGIYVRHPDITQVSEAISLLFSVQQVTLREFLAFRQMVEPGAAALAAVHATDEQREAILQAAEADQPEFGPVVDLHVLIGESTGNGVLRLVLQALHSPMAAHFRSDKIHEHHRTETMKAHRKIAEVIASRDAAGAERAMKRHLDAYARYLEEVGLIDEPIVPQPRWQMVR